MSDTGLGAKKLGFWFKFGYGAGYGGISVLLYNLFYIFFMLFLTDVAGISPIYAGTISFIAVLWDGISDPAVGYLSDRSKSKYGRKRPYMIVGLFIVALSAVLLFTVVDFSQAAKNFYYTIMAMVFWLGLTMYDIPYNTLATDLTDNPQERTSLRYFATFFLVVTMVFLNTFMWPAIGFFAEKTASGPKGWQLSVIVVAAVAFILGFISWNVTRGREDKNVVIPTENPLKSLKDVIKLKPYRYLLAFSFVLAISQVIVQSSMPYVMIYKAGFNDAQIGGVFTIAAVFNLIWIFGAHLVRNKFSNHNIYVFSVIVTGILLFSIPYVLDMTKFWVFLLYFTFWSFSVFSLWTYGYTFAYEIGDLSELRTGTRHDGILVSYTSFILKMGGAVAMWLIGFVLEIFEYVPNAIEQSSKTLTGMTLLITVFPLVLHAITLVLLLLYPLKGKKFSLVETALLKKRNGEEYSMDGIE